MAENGILKIGFAEMNISADADDKAVADTTILIGGCAKRSSAGRNY